MQRIQSAASYDQLNMKYLNKPSGNNSGKKILTKIYIRQTQFSSNVSSSQSNVYSFQRKYRSQNERYIFTQLSLIVAAFVLGYIPTAIYQDWTIELRSNIGGEGNADYWFGVLSYLCLRFSECLNPLIYNLGSNKMRRATRKLLKLQK